MTEHQRSTAAPSEGGSSKHPPKDTESTHPGASRGQREHDRALRHRGEPRIVLDVPGPSPAHEPEIPEERLDADAIRVIARLRHTGHQAYFVGGCVRDALLGRKPKDFDVATSAHPGEVRAIFRNCRLIGRRFRLAHVYFRGGKVIEVATFRKNPVDAADDLADGDLLITRDNVFGTAEEDARRRDFTVNGLFYDVFAGEVIDYVGGRADLEAHRIATIGDPEIRMQEDPVRALRAMRFASRLGFTIEPETFAAMRRHAAELGRCAPPRLLEEIFKILRCGASARAFELLRSSGALAVVLPALAASMEAAQGEPRRKLAHLAALDGLVRSGEDPSEAVLLGALLLHLPAGGPGPRDERDRLLAELVATARLPRKIAERARLALASQRLFRHARRRRRGIAAQAYFTDALQLLRIGVEATGEGAELLASWEAERATAPELQDSDPELDETLRDEVQEISLERRGPRHGAHRSASARPQPAAPVAREADAGQERPSAGDDGLARRRRRRRGGRRRGRRGGVAAAASTPQA